MSQRHNLHLKFLVFFLLAVGVGAVRAADVRPVAAPSIQFVWMGGNDCPPCMAWRALELPKLQAMEEFRTVHFSYVSKTIKSAVPSAVFLPEDVKPLKDKLDAAGGGRAGSPQWAILVNGHVIDYQSGTRTAEQFGAMFAAILGDLPYPSERCEAREQGRCRKVREGRKLPRAVLAIAEALPAVR